MEKKIEAKKQPEIKVSQYCDGEKCNQCGNPATQKVEQTKFDDVPIGHGYVAYLCQKHFERLVMPYKFKKQPAMSLEECKDEICRRYELADFKALIGKVSAFPSQYANVALHVINEVAELYANQFRELDKWISVEDRLPENMKDVIVCLKNGMILICTYREMFKSFQILTTVDDIPEVNPVIKWQPLPKP